VCEVAPQPQDSDAGVGLSHPPDSVAVESIAADSITRNAVFAVGTRMTTAAITAVVTLVLGRVLGPTEYGYFALAMAISTIAVFLSDLGITAATPRFLAERTQSRPAIRAVLFDALRMKLLAAVPICVALAALAGPIANAFDTPEAAWPLRGMAIVVLTQGLFLFVTGAFEALGRISINLRIVSAESVVEGTAMVLLVALGAGATGAAFGRAIGYSVGVGIALAFIWRVVGRRQPGDERHSGLRPRDIARYAGALLIIDGIFRLFSQIDVLLIGALLNGGRAVGLFEIPIMLAWFLHYPAGAIASAVAPRLARREDRPPDVAVFARALRYIVALQGIFLAPIVVWAEPILVHLLGAKYRDSAEVLRALAPFILLAGPAMLVSVGVNYMGEARRRIPLALVMLTANIAIDVALLPELGIVAGAIGNDVAYAIWVPGHMWILHRVLGLDLRPQALVLLRATVAAAVAAVPLLLIGTDVGIVVLVLGGALACAVYLVALRLIGELARDDIDFLRGLLARRFAWARR
jgi:O-antigen/teichoic acid export membrane protein